MNGSKICAYLDSFLLLVLSGLLWMINQFAIAASLRGVDKELLVAQLSYRGAADYRRWFADLRARDLWDAYGDHLVLDGPHPWFYGAFLTVAIAMVYHRKRMPDRWSKMLVLPAFAAACDGIENGIQTIFLRGDDRITDALALLSTIASWCKWLSVAICLVFLVVGVVRPPSSHVLKSASR